MRCSSPIRSKCTSGNSAVRSDPSLAKPGIEDRCETLARARARSRPHGRAPVRHPHPHVVAAVNGDGKGASFPSGTAAIRQRRPNHSVAHFQHTRRRTIARMPCVHRQALLLNAAASRGSSRRQHFIDDAPCGVLRAAPRAFRPMGTYALSRRSTGRTRRLPAPVVPTGSQRSLHCAAPQGARELP